MNITNMKYKNTLNSVPSEIVRSSYIDEFDHVLVPFGWRHELAKKLPKELRDKKARPKNPARNGETSYLDIVLRGRSSEVYVIISKSFLDALVKSDSDEEVFASSILARGHFGQNLSPVCIGSDDDIQKYRKAIEEDLRIAHIDSWSFKSVNVVISKQFFEMYYCNESAYSEEFLEDWRSIIEMGYRLATGSRKGVSLVDIFRWSTAYPDCSIYSKTYIRKTVDLLEATGSSAGVSRMRL